MKVLHLIYKNGIAGAERYLQHLMKPLRQYNIECHLILVCAPSSKQALEDYCTASNQSGIPTLLITARKTGFINTAGRIAAYMKQQQIRYLHSHLINSDVIAVLVKKFFYRSVIIISTKHGYSEDILKLLSDKLDKNLLLLKARNNKYYYYISKFVINNSDHHYAVSKAAATLYHDLRLTDEVMPYIHHGIKVEIQPKEYSLNKYRFSSPQIITVGRLEEVKGQQYLLEAMPAVIERFSSVTLLIIGEGADKKRLEQIASDLGITSNVKFIGFTHDPYSYVNNSDVIVLPSLFETFGLVFIEAFALRTPVIAFDAPAGNEIMENNVTAKLVTPRSAKMLAEQMIALLSDPNLAAQLADAAFQKYTESYNSVRMVKETAEYYHKVAQETN